MRMIGIGLSGFLLAGIALLLSSMNILEKGQRHVRAALAGPQLVFEHRIPAQSTTGHMATLSRTNSDQPVILSGFPAYQSVAFALPVDARPTSGYLQINATSQVLDGVEGALRISIRNTRRGEILLHPDKAGQAVQIPLSPTDLAGPQLVVSFSLQGTDPQQQCGPDDGISAVVEIETTSAVHLTLDAPLASVGDRVRAWGDTVRVGWPHWLKQEEQVRRLVRATELGRRGMTTVFQPEAPDQALSISDLRTLLDTVPEHGQSLAPDARFAVSGPNAGIRRFHRKAIWRVRYDLMGAWARPMPGQVALDMQFGRVLGDHRWSVSATLNGRLVYQTTMSSAQSTLAATFDVPPDLHLAANTLEIVATTTRDRMGPCDEGQELMAEVLPTSRFIAGDMPFADPLADLQNALRPLGTVTVAQSGLLTAVDAATASQMLRLLVPGETPLRPSMQSAHITVLTPATRTQEAALKAPAWFVTTTADASGLDVRALQIGDPLPSSGVALLVTPPSFPEGAMR
ncbi:cellulose biosynthesis cyclic di-GMP-binding regulatory protein BcsB [Tateyamaria sp. SN6-1]|uniref:cellulose biosynthesis cyclic di-GMP-binding regulatory protein BcsB n=1 Tax=Tateyamaria sp. SN6-1 TaxID=3092148 RepID=UPI0039F60435